MFNQNIFKLALTTCNCSNLKLLNVVIEVENITYKIFTD